VSSGTPRRIEVPSTATPTPPPGIFSLDGEVNGQTLRRLREARRLTMDELAEATKIRRPYLAAIEEQDLDALPSRVYLRGFLTQIARVLRVDKEKLADGYLAFIARFGR
jgi:transcriptional regulator with XRE-family HTH domain